MQSSIQYGTRALSLGTTWSNNTSIQSCLLIVLPAPILINTRISHVPNWPTNNKWPALILHVISMYIAPSFLTDSKAFIAIALTVCRVGKNSTSIIWNNTRWSVSQGEMKAAVIRLLSGGGAWRAGWCHPWRERSVLTLLLQLVIWQTPAL